MMKRVFTQKEMKKALGNKGFHARQGDHTFFFLTVDGKTTRVFTKFSHDGRDYSGRLLSLVRNQLGRLSHEEFERLIECPLKYEEYVRLLRERNLIA
jgi:hypothetical protein